MSNGNNSFALKCKMIISLVLGGLFTIGGLSAIPKPHPGGIAGWIGNSMALIFGILFLAEYRKSKRQLRDETAQ